MPHLNSAQLAAFAAIVAGGSFEAAGRALHVTASAISQRLKALEDTLGQVLVVRGTPCRATAAGQLLLRHALQVSTLEEELRLRLGMHGAEPARPVRLPVAVNADSLDGWFVEAASACCAHGGIALDLRVEDQGHSAALLRDGEVMAAISASPAATQGCSVEYLGSMRYLALAAPAFCNRYFAAGVDAATLAEAPVLVYNAKDRMQWDFMAAHGGSPDEPPAHFVPSTRAFVELAEQGLGWGMIPEHLAQANVRSGALVEIVADRHIDVGLYWHRWQIASTPLATLSEAVRDAARRHLRAPA
ncbi:LysR family transcriptional regulator ArgP [Pseudoduganella albidiflava]|uniref:Transcriptional regulator ArgP n=1 Tax=Pseudoduganella albidiflava TaxID=321983 RepID=A0A411WZD3_9BURK|nr:LysR family transcriptional regulator ArgP [Pseudoduganella albidiflava]QBI02062.1 LysR family transcriptional regulator ArgP [Pseudoduganella albidiflava]GGY65246.1 transcriptional regulator ArgP [Pseudoduganella albidiflava]